MKRTIFIFLVLALFIPRIQEKLKLFQFKKLAGVTENLKYPTFNFKQWFEGTFQTEYDNFKSQNFGFRSLFIRLYNQTDYSFFKKVHAEVVVGKNGYLFEKNYLTDLSGESFIGNESMQKQIKQLAEIQKYLEAKNILLITTLAPGKTYYLDKYIPNNYFRNTTENTNYNAILKFSKEENINLIDFNKWFLNLRDTISVPLFPQRGIHWNHYGMALCADSILKYIEAKKNVRLNDFKWSLTFPDTPYATDNDLGDLLNLYHPLPFQKMPVPKFEFQNDSTNKKLNILTIGDSFYWTIFNERVFGNEFNKETYYYYCSTIYPTGTAASNTPADLNLFEEIEKYNVILLLQSSGNYNNPGVNFVQQFNSQMENKNRYKSEAMVAFETNESLKQEIIRKSKEMKIALDSAKLIVADSLAEIKMNDVSAIKIKMRNDSEWLDALRSKSYASNTTLENTMQSDAEWMLLNK